MFSDSPKGQTHYQGDGCKDEHGKPIMTQAATATCNRCKMKFSENYPSLNQDEPSAPSREEAKYIEDIVLQRLLTHQNTVCAPKVEKPVCPCGKDRLTLKWGTLKGWHFHTDKALNLLQTYSALGSSASAMMQKDSPEQKAIICELIDECNGEIWNDWEGEKMSKKKAKKYVMGYGNN